MKLFVYFVKFLRNEELKSNSQNCKTKIYEYKMNNVQLKVSYHIFVSLSNHFTSLICKIFIGTRDILLSFFYSKCKE